MTQPELREALVAYTVLVRQQRSQALLSLQNFDGHGADLLDFLHDHLKGLQQNAWDHDASQTRLYTKNVERVTVSGKPARTLTATVVTGNYGERSTFRDLQEPVDSEPAFERYPHHTEDRPFHIRAHFPAAPVRGLILTHMTGNAGVKSVFWDKSFKEKFKARYPELMLDIEHFYPESIWKQYEEHGTLFGAKATKVGVPRDIATRFGAPVNLANDLILEIRLRGRRGQRFRSNWPLNLRQDAEKLRRALHLEIAGEAIELDDLRFEVEIDGQEMTVQIQDETSPRAKYIVPAPRTIPTGTPPQTASRRSLKSSRRDCLATSGETETGKGLTC